MKNLLRAVIVSLLFVSGLAEAQEQQSAPKTGFKAGEEMPFHVVNFIGGGRSQGAGCPSVMISNGRTRGIEIWTQTSTEDAFRLAAALEGDIPHDGKHRAFLLVFNKNTEAIHSQTRTHKLTRFYVCIPRGSGTKTLPMIAGSNESELVLFLMERKSIKSRHVFNPGELTDEKLQALVKETKAFFNPAK